MSSATVPKILQRFRARELQQAINAGALRGSSINVLRYERQIDVGAIRQDKLGLHNPFLPQALFEQPAKVNSKAAMTPISTLEASPKKAKDRKKWAPPKYSLRRQADLVKAARASGTLHLLPPGPKLSVAELAEAKKRALEASKSAGARTKQSKVRSSSEDMGQKVGKGLGAEANANSSMSSSPVGIANLSKNEAKLLRGSPQAGYPGIVFQWKGKVPLSGREKRGGLTVYAGRRRMFKGHKWERMLKKRTGQIRARLRDMRKRIARFRSVSPSPRFYWGRDGEHESDVYFLSGPQAETSQAAGACETSQEGVVAVLIVVCSSRTTTYLSVIISAFFPRMNWQVSSLSDSANESINSGLQEMHEIW